MAVTAGIDFGFATFFTVFLNLTAGYTTTAGYVLICTPASSSSTASSTASACGSWPSSPTSACGGTCWVCHIAVVLFFVPSHHASASFIFTKFENMSTLGVPIYVFMLGLLMAQYTFTGYDASAHMSEETHNADLAAPRGIVSSIVVSLVAGWILILAITSVIPTNPATYATTAANTAAPVAIWRSALSRLGAELLLLIAVVAQAFCGMASVTANSRMLFAFSRDGAVPGHKYWHRINPRTRTPTNSIWFCVVFAFILAVPSLWSGVAYAAVTSIATIGLYIAYVLPTLLRRLQGKSWQGGRWSLGKWSPFVGWVGIIWVAFIAVLFLLPEVAFSSINRDNFNYAPIAVGVVLLFSGGYWLLSARKWFTGPKVQGDAEELSRIEVGFANIERELEEVD